MKGCPACEAKWARGYPLCPECGNLSPAIFSPGGLAVEIGEVPSQHIRNELLALLKSWFPRIDLIRAENQLKSGRTLLLRGVDEASGRRLLEAVRHLKVEGNLIAPGEDKIGIARLWNTGLVASGLSLGLAVIIGGWTALVLVAAAFAAPVVGAFLKRTGTMTPLVESSSDPESEYWMGVSQEYSELLHRLQENDKNTLQSLFQTVFDLRERLRSGSLPSVAAGSENGELQNHLNDALRSGLDSARRISLHAEDHSDAAREELERLAEVLRKTYDWFTNLETGAVKASGAIESELNEITQSIDRIVQEARLSYPRNRVSLDKKTLA